MRYQYKVRKRQAAAARLPLPRPAPDGCSGMSRRCPPGHTRTDSPTPVPALPDLVRASLSVTDAILALRERTSRCLRQGHAAIAAIMALPLAVLFVAGPIVQRATLAAFVGLAGLARLLRRRCFGGGQDGATVVCEVGL